MRFDAPGTFNEKEALSFAKAFEDAAKRSLGVVATAVLTNVDGSLSEFRVHFHTEFIGLGSFLKFFCDGYDAACDFRRVT